MDWTKRLRLFLAGLGLVLLAACGRAELYGKLSEGQANEMIAALQRAAPCRNVPRRAAPCRAVPRPPSRVAL